MVYFKILNSSGSSTILVEAKAYDTHTAIFTHKIAIYNLLLFEVRIITGCKMQDIKDIDPI